MKLVMFSPKAAPIERGWPGRLDGESVIQLAAQTLQVFLVTGGALREHAVYPLAEIDLRAPVMYPPTIRIFDGDDFAFANTTAIRGHEDEIAYPDGASELRTGPAVAAVIGAEGTIGGFTAANVWRAPDLPGAKARDFALSIGPVLVTADEYDAGPEWAARVEHASRNTALRTGDLLLSPPAAGEAVARGEVVEVAIDGLGVLRNVVSSVRRPVPRTGNWDLPR